jgi:hypothetical protein
VCHFLSAVVTRNGDVLTNDHTDSHSELITLFGLPDDRECRHFAKVELTPGDDPTDADGYTFRLDEGTAPLWWEDVAGRAEETMRGMVRRMVVRDKRALLFGGRWIVADGAEIGEARGCVLQRVSGGTINDVWGGTIHKDHRKEQTR